MSRPIAADGTIRYSTAAAFAWAAVHTHSPSTPARIIRSIITYIALSLNPFSPNCCPLCCPLQVVGASSASDLRVGRWWVDTTQRPGEPVDGVLDFVAGVVIGGGIHG